MPNGVPKKYNYCKPLSFTGFASACQKNAQKKPIILIGFSQFNTILKLLDVVFFKFPV